MASALWWSAVAAVGLASLGWLATVLTGRWRPTRVDLTTEGVTVQGHLRGPDKVGWQRLVAAGVTPAGGQLTLTARGELGRRYPVGELRSDPRLTGLLLSYYLDPRSDVRELADGRALARIREGGFGAR
ncbi:MAG: hypothetical protein LWW86_04910 [Micrococcales bacterium]|nr:hypothetical protein [Micrococcales bacterium]